VSSDSTLGGPVDEAIAPDVGFAPTSGTIRDFRVAFDADHVFYADLDFRETGKTLTLDHGRLWRVPRDGPIDDGTWERILDALFAFGVSTGMVREIVEWIEADKVYVARRWVHPDDSFVAIVWDARVDYLELGRTMRFNCHRTDDPSPTVRLDVSSASWLSPPGPATQADVHRVLTRLAGLSPEHTVLSSRPWTIRYDGDQR